VVLDHFEGIIAMKTTVFKKIVEKRCKILDRKIFERYCTDAYEFIDLDVALLMKERAVYQEALRECHRVLKQEEQWASLASQIEDLLGEQWQD